VFKWIGRAIVALLVLGCAGFALLYYKVSNPAQENLPVPPSMIAATSSTGAALLSRAEARADYDLLHQNFATQVKGSWCGVASSSIVLSALGKKTTQEDFFTDDAKKVRSWWKVTFGGMPLDALGGLLQAHGVQAEVHHAGDSSLDEFRARASENLGREGDFVLVNYLRSAVDQAGPAGHISPVAAYDQKTDRFLVLDVASYKYPPVWITAEKLFGAMNTVDSDGGKTRGWVLVKR
jgi:hypothetical protein